MKAAPFDYVAAKTISEASAALASGGSTTAAIAGGQSLLPMLNLRVALPDLVVDLNGLDELRENSIEAGVVRVGALTTHATIEDGLFADIFGGLLQRVASKISYRAVRNYGTIGGSVALADPAADWPGCLMALDARVQISGLKGPRSEQMRDFVQGQYQTSLTSDEIIVGFELPRPTFPMRWGVYKVVRKSGAFANSLAYAVSAGKRGAISVVLVAASSRPCLLPKVAQLLEAGDPTEEKLRLTIAEEVGSLVPKDDSYLNRLHTSSVFRAIREMQSQ